MEELVEWGWSAVLVEWGWSAVVLDVGFVRQSIDALLSSLFVFPRSHNVEVCGSHPR
jgi:hypothetical protein